MSDSNPTGHFARPEPPRQTVVPCKVCKAAAPLFDVVDFNRSCLESSGGVVLPRTGLPVWYRRCDGCGFLFTDAFDGWSHEAFHREIYNDGYAAVDPGYLTERPQSNAAMLAKLFGAFKDSIRILDYGGGNGQLERNLRDQGFASVQTYDPFDPSSGPAPDGRFDLVTCFEVVEHVPDPHEVTAVLERYVEADGIVFFSTLLQPADIMKQRMGWWYAAPRNGHVSMHTAASLAHVWQQFGRRIASAGGIHAAYRTVPEFARSILPVQAATAS